jgi:uncharacterized Zn finger protein
MWRWGSWLERIRAGRNCTGANEDFHFVGLLEWLKRRARARRDTPEALALALQIFRIRPTLEGYEEIKNRATKAGQWGATRRELLEQLRKGKSYDREMLIHIHLREGEIDEAIGALKSQRRPDLASPGPGWGYDSDHSSSLELEVAKAAEKARPKVSLEIYRKRAETLVRGGGRASYQEACKYLRKVRALYCDVGEAERWDKYLAQVRDKNQRLRALKEEMSKAGL